MEYLRCFALIQSILLVLSVVYGAVNPNDYYNNIDGFSKKNTESLQPDVILNTDIFGQYQSQVDDAKNAPEQNYYDNEGKLNEDANTARSSEIYQIGRAVNNKEPDLNSIEQSAYMKNDQLYVDDAYNVAHGISDTKIDCTNGRTCHYEYEPRSCEKSNSQNFSCTREPVVETVSYKIPSCNHYVINGTNIQTISGANAQGYCQVGIQHWQASGNNSSIDESHNSSIQTPANYSHVKIVLFSYMTGQFENTSAGTHEAISGLGTIYVGTMYSRGYYEKSLAVPQSKSIATYSFSIGLGFATGRGQNSVFYGTFVEYPQTQSKNVVSSWQSTCPWGNPSKPQGCSYKGQEYCTVSGSTRLIHDLPIYQSCWKYQQDYSCSSSPEIDTCTHMAEDNCNLSAQACDVKLAGVCVQYHYDYNCPVKKCDGQQFACGKPAFCMDGDCYTSDDQKQSPDDLGKAAAEMAAAQAAADNLVTNPDGSISIYTGERMGCSVAIAGSNNCCTNGGGWNPVGSCTEEEKHLAEQKQKQLSIDNGSYCKNKALGVCTSEEHPSCVYPDLLVKDIIEQGVIGQLYHGSVSGFYGDSKDTKCRGISPEELEQIDFDKIDFTNIEEDLKNNMDFPTSGDGSENANDKSQCLADGSCDDNYKPDDDKNCLTDGTCHFD